MIAVILSCEREAFDGKSLSFLGRRGKHGTNAALSPAPKDSSILATALRRWLRPQNDGTLYLNRRTYSRRVGSLR